jgi:hypothetical protein
MPKATQPVWAGAPLASLMPPGGAEMIAMIVEVHEALGQLIAGQLTPAFS